MTTLVLSPILSLTLSSVTATDTIVVSHAEAGVMPLAEPDLQEPQTAAPPPTPAPTPTLTPAATATPRHRPKATRAPTPSPTSTRAPLGWPGPSNTGVPAGTLLTAYTGSQAITVAGTVIDSKSITKGCLDIQASNVTIKNSRISGLGCYAAIRTDGGNGLLVEDTEINGTGTTSSNPGDDFGIEGHNGSFTCLHCNVHGVGVDFTTSDTATALIQDSWGWGLVASPTSHNQNFLSNGSTKGVTLRHNRLDNPLRETATISLFGDFAPIQNVTVDDNLLNGGDFCVYGGHDPTKPYGTQDQNVKFTNNHFMRTSEPGAFYANCALFGPVTAFDSASPGNAWSGNVWDDTGDLVPPGG